MRTALPCGLTPLNIPWKTLPDACAGPQRCRSLPLASDALRLIRTPRASHGMSAVYTIAIISSSAISAKDDVDRGYAGG